MTPQEKSRQAAAALAAGKSDPKRTRILIPPSLVIESISPGHERHDRNLKRRWYAEFGVPNYWILNAFDNSLECLALEGGAYRSDARGKGSEAIKSDHPFPGLIIPLAEIWEG